jgi:hypothetical protein
MYPSKDGGWRVVALALIPTSSVSLVASASDDDPIRKPAEATSQVRSKGVFLEEELLK